MIENGVYIESGNNVKDKFLAKPGYEECASQCALTPGCVGWTFNTFNSYCWLKADDSKKGRGDDWITGTKSCGFKSNYP